MFEYPIYAKSIQNGHIVEFTALRKGTVVERGNNTFSMDVGEYSGQWIEHNRCDVWEPCEDPRQSKTNKMLKALKDS